MFWLVPTLLPIRDHHFIRNFSQLAFWDMRLWSSMGWANLGPWDKFGLLPVFLNKILLEHITFICLLLLLILFYFYHHLSPIPSSTSTQPPPLQSPHCYPCPWFLVSVFHILSIAIFVMQQPSWIFVKQTVCPAKPKIFPIWPFTRKLWDILFYLPMLFWLFSIFCMPLGLQLLNPLSDCSTC